MVTVMWHFMHGDYGTKVMLLLNYAIIELTEKMVKIVTQLPVVLILAPIDEIDNISVFNKANGLVSILHNVGA